MTFHIVQFLFFSYLLISRNMALIIKKISLDTSTHCNLKAISNFFVDTEDWSKILRQTKFQKLFRRVMTEHIVNSISTPLHSCCLDFAMLWLWQWWGSANVSWVCDSHQAQYKHPLHFTSQTFLHAAQPPIGQDLEIKSCDWPIMTVIRRPRPGLSDTAGDTFLECLS